MIISQNMRSGRVPDPTDRVHSGIQINHAKEAKCLRPSPEKQVDVKCSKETHDRIKRPVLEAVNEKFSEYNAETEILTFLGMNQEIKNRLFKTSGGNKELDGGAGEAYRKALEKCDSDIAKTKAQSDANEKNIEHRAEVIKKVQGELVKIQKQKLLQAEAKRKPSRIFSEAEKSRGIHWQDLSAEALAESKQRLLDEKSGVNKKGSKAGTEIEKLQKQMEPHAEKINVLKTQLDKDLNESEYKELRLSIEFHEMKLDRILSKISPHEKEQADLNGQVKEIDKKIEILNCAIDGGVSFSKELHNFRRKQDRLRARIEHFIKDREALVVLSENLNKKWRELTGDLEDICPPLVLRAEDKMYFI